MAEQALTKFDKEWLKKNATIGIKGVDRTDIQPPQILLIQKSSNLTDFVDSEGTQPKPGQFFHTGRMKIYEAVDCHIIFAAKNTYMDRRSDPPTQKDQYITFGLLKEGYGLFGMRFKSSAINVLSPLFTAVLAQSTPIFAFNLKIEAKELQNEQGTWHIPAVRVGEVEKDQEVLNKLYKAAIKFDDQTDSYVAEKEDDEGEKPVKQSNDEDDDSKPDPKPGNAGKIKESIDKENKRQEEVDDKDDVNIDDIPF